MQGMAAKERSGQIRQGGLPVRTALEHMEALGITDFDVYYDAVQAGLINPGLPNGDREAIEDAYFLEYAPDP